MEIEALRAKLDALNLRRLHSQLSSADVGAVWSAPPTYRSHPFRRLLLAAERVPGADAAGDDVAKNTDRAIGAITSSGVEAHAPWLAGRIATAANTADFENASAALGEIRVLGDLVRAGFSPMPNGTASHATPDFEVTLAGAAVTLEVHTKQMNAAEAASLAEFTARQKPTVSRGGVSISEHVVVPAGAPKGGESIAENVASKFAAIKPRAKQASTIQPSILWLDLQDEAWLGVAPRDVVPVRLGKGELTSTGLWHAFYGLNGTAILESFLPARACPINVWRQRFDGMFKQCLAWSAIVLALPKQSIVLEHPGPTNPLGPAQRDALFTLPRFDPTHSWVDWAGRGDLIAVVENERARLDAIARS